MSDDKSNGIDAIYSCVDCGQEFESLKELEEWWPTFCSRFAYSSFQAACPNRGYQNSNSMLEIVNP
jgi:hypothetical protein